VQELGLLGSNHGHAISTEYLGAVTTAVEPHPQETAAKRSRQTGEAHGKAKVLLCVQVDRLCLGYRSSDCAKAESLRFSYHQGIDNALTAICPLDRDNGDAARVFVQTREGKLQIDASQFGRFLSQ